MAGSTISRLHSLYLEYSSLMGNGKAEEAEQLLRQNTDLLLPLRTALIDKRFKLGLTKKGIKEIDEGFYQRLSSQISLINRVLEEEAHSGRRNYSA